MNNGLFTYLAALLLFGSNGIIAAAIALPSSDIVLLRTFLGALTLVTILAITQRHKLQAPISPRAKPQPSSFSGAALGASWIFSVPRLPNDRRRRILAAVLLRPHHCSWRCPRLSFGEKPTGGKIAGFIAVACGAFLIAAQGLRRAICPLRASPVGSPGILLCALMVIKGARCAFTSRAREPALQLSAAL